MAEQTTRYAATLSIDYPDRELNRLSSFFRIFASIPIFIVIGLIIVYQKTLSPDHGWLKVKYPHGFEFDYIGVIFGKDGKTGKIHFVTFVLEQCYDI